MKKHFFAKISWKDLERLPKSDLLKKFHLPENKFPKKFILDKENIVIGGYFVSYFPKISTEDLYLLCKNKKWHNIVNANGSFLLFCIDLNNRELFIVTDQTGTFPCYFYLNDKEFVLSTSFSDLFDLVKNPVLEIEKTLEFVYGDTTISDKTFVKDLYLLPPGMVAKIAKGSLSTDSFFDYRKILENEARFKNLQEYSNAFLGVLEMSVKDRLNVLEKDAKICADISSGFDSSLISYLVRKNYQGELTCYSEIADDAHGDTDPDIVLELAKKHNFKVKFIKYDDLYPFSTEDDLDFIKDGPSHVQKSQVDRYFRSIGKDGMNVRFTGEGGDEAYGSTKGYLELKFKFPVQNKYFTYQRIRKYGIEDVLTSKSIDILLDKERLKHKIIYTPLIANSVINLEVIMFPFFWEAEVWPIIPFADTRVIEVASMAPKRKPKEWFKQKLWKDRKEIFVDSQFKEKIGTESHYGRFLTERKDFIVKVLENSLLGQAGYARVGEIIKDLKNGNEKKYLEGDKLRYITNLLEVEYFAQEKKLRMM